MNSLQRAVQEFKRHERAGRERTSQVTRLLGRKAESRIVVFVSEHNDDSFPSGAELSQTMTNQLAPNLAALMVRQNGHRGQRSGGHRALRRFYCHSAEQNVADNLAVNLCGKRQQDGSFYSQPVNQISLVGAPESSFVHFPNLLPVVRLLVSDK
jgi:hypothetical protein